MGLFLRFYYPPYPPVFRCSDGRLRVSAFGVIRGQLAYVEPLTPSISLPATGNAETVSEAVMDDVLARFAAILA